MRRGGRGDTNSEHADQVMPAGLAPLDAARQVLEEFLGSRKGEASGGSVERAEIAHIQHGQSLGPNDAVEPGLLVKWRQGSHEFGLLMPIARLARQAGGLEAVPFYLGLAIDEPHSPSADGSCHWFLDLPSGPY